MANFIQRIFGSGGKTAPEPPTQAPEQAPEQVKEKSYFGSSYAPVMYTPTQIDALFANLYGNTACDWNPRDFLPAYRKIWKYIPQFADVVGRKRNLIGNPRIESEDKRWAEDMNQFLSQLKSMGEISNPFAKDYGIDTIVGQLSETMMVDGSGFTSFLDAQGMPITGRKPIDYVKIHASDRFVYQQPYMDVYELHYISRGFDQVITAERERSFRALQFERTQWVWGKPLAYHSEYVLRLFLVSTGAREQSNARNGAPLEFTMIGFQTPTNLDPSITKMLSDDSRSYAENAATVYRQAIANRHTKMNEGVDVVGVAPTGVTIGSHTYGKDAQSPPSYESEVDMYLRWAASSWGYPLALIGMDNSSDGLGSAKYNQAAAIAVNAAQVAQRYLSANLVMPLIDAVMLSERKTAPKYTIIWDGQTLEDQKAIAETKKVTGEAMEANLRAYESALMNLSDDEAKRIGEELGLI